jgi:hypothetical protein
LVVFVRFGFVVLVERDAFDVAVGVDVVGSPLSFCCDFRSWIHPAWVAVGDDPVH